MLTFSGMDNANTKKIEITKTASITINTDFNNSQLALASLATKREYEMSRFLDLEKNHPDPSEADFANFTVAVQDFLVATMTDWTGAERVGIDAKGKKKVEKVPMTEANIRAMFDTSKKCAMVFHKIMGTDLPANKDGGTLSEKK